MTVFIAAPFDPSPNGGDFGVGGSLGESEEREDEENQEVAGIVIGSTLGFIILAVLIAMGFYCCTYILCGDEDNEYVNTIAYLVWLDNQYNCAVHMYIICMIALYIRNS